MAPNRIKELEVQAPGEILVSDITYLKLEKGFAYLYLVTDLFSRKILGYHVTRDLTHYSACIAFEKAVRELNGSSVGTIHHSDRGCQYCCHEYLEHLEEHGVLSSMTDDNHCYQNAVAERINGILKDEFNLDAVFRSFDELRATVDKAIRVYNTKRLPRLLNQQLSYEASGEFSTCGYLPRTPSWLLLTCVDKFQDGTQSLESKVESPVMMELSKRISDYGL